MMIFSEKKLVNEGYCTEKFDRYYLKSNSNCKIERKKNLENFDPN